MEIIKKIDVERKKNYIVTANSKVGKTQIADFIFVLSVIMYAYQNKEKIRERTREYYEKKYKKKMLEYNKEYYEKNKEKIREYQKEYRLKKKLEKQNNN